MLDVKGSFVDPVIQGSLACLLSEEDRPQTNPTVLQEQTKQFVRTRSINIAAFMRNSRTALRAEATLAGSHSQANLTTHIVKLPPGKRIHGAFEHLAGDKLTLTDNLFTGR